MLTKDDTPPVHTRHPSGESPWVLVCEHAGNQIPASLGTLGLNDTDLLRHIAWDIGIISVANLISGQLDATLISQPYSRLVIDCNRRPDDPELVAAESDGTFIPGNQNLTAEEIKTRHDAIHDPFHDCIKGVLDKDFKGEGQKVLVTLHSFTPQMSGASPRPWHIGVIYNRERRLADSLLRILGGLQDVHVGDNEPYAMSDNNVHTIPYHAERRGIPAVEIELRQDLILDEEGQHRWAGLLGDALEEARKELVKNTF